MDDNIRAFYYFNNNKKIRILDGTLFLALEDFCNRYENISMAGPNYCMFIIKKEKRPPFIMNTRIYSCNLIKNNIPYRWRGRYNEDTDLSLRILKDGFCTVQFNILLQHKVRTQRMKGGNTKEFYEKEGTKPKTDMLYKLHPDVVRIVHKFSRYHHQVDYLPFKHNKLKLKKGITINQGTSNYNLVLKKIDKNKV